MDQKLYDNLKIDLHIHSRASEYKENPKIVEKSTVENLDVLLEKLNKNSVGIVAISDHNRFDHGLYKELENKICSKEYKGTVRLVLPSVEFDVVLDEGNEACHIVCVFNNKEKEKVIKIQEVLERPKSKLTSKEDSYKLKDFEKILSEIRLDTILIGHQKVDPKNTESSGHESVSESVDDFYAFMKFGYLNALEYQKPDVQGMVKNSLRDLNLRVPTITGSDCHEWSEYPAHSKGHSSNKIFTKVKCLPTFKGLLFALSSFETRVNKSILQRQEYFEELVINGEKVPLSRSLNVIIGDNGSGKTTVIEILNNLKLLRHQELLKKANNIDFVKIGLSLPRYIEQGWISSNAKEGTLFEASSFEKIPTLQKFRNTYSGYADELISYLKKRVKNKILRDEFEKSYFVFEEHEKFDNFFLNFEKDLKNTGENLHLERFEALKRLFEDLVKENKSNSDYYKNESIDLEKLTSEFEKILKLLEGRKIFTEKENRAKGLVIEKIKNYELSIDGAKTDTENLRTEYVQRKSEFKNKFIDYVNETRSKVEPPKFPEPIEGSSTRIQSNFVYTKQANYHLQDLKAVFFLKMFTGTYRSEKAALEIDTEESLVKALNNITAKECIGDWKLKEVESFINKYSEAETYIGDITTESKVGGTAGEVSISYYKNLFGEPETVSPIILIDQPEDDISPARIKRDLITYLNSVRDKKQVIFSTHNPLLAVNLDADNIIFLRKTDNNIKATSGCLEYENPAEEISITKIIEDNLDGGHDAIERRLMLYGKKN